MDNNLSLRITAEPKDLTTIRRFVEEKAVALKVDQSAIYDILLAVTEMATNILVHGYQGQPGLIEIKVWQEGSSLVVQLRDQAPPFDPTQVAPPDLSIPLEKRSYGGMGIYLAKQFVDHLSHQYLSPNGNEVTIVKEGIVHNSYQEESYGNDN